MREMFLYTNKHSKGYEETNNGFRKDFNNPGDFIKKDWDFSTYYFPGLYKNNKWIKQNDSQNEAYSIYIRYNNKNSVYVFLEAGIGGGIDLKPAFDFVKEVAKKHYLFNELLKTKHCENFEALEIEMQRAVNVSLRRNDEHAYRNGQTWDKIMTLKEAKKLFKDLKMKINWPE